ncbi:hypothetical protein [Lacticaseibacillus sharpeae]|nr:hypothetical protein [Lacticaseibacillus sharpeae]
MLSLFRLKLVSLNRLMLTLVFLSTLVSITIAGGQSFNTTMGIGNYGTSRADQQALQISAARRQIERNHQNTNPEALSLSNQSTTVFSQIIKAVEQDDYLATNKIVLSTLNKSPNIFMLGFPDFTIPASNAAIFCRYVIKHQLNVNASNQASDVLPVVISALGARPSIPATVSYQIIFLLIIFFCILFISHTVTNELHAGTINLLQTSPVTFTNQTIINGLTIVGTLLIAVGAGIMAACVVLMLVFHRHLGTWLFPIIRTNSSGTLIMPMRDYLVKYILLIIVWLILFFLFATILSLLVRNSLIITSVLLLITFANQLGLLDLAPTRLLQYLPSAMQNPSDVILTSGIFANTGYWQSLLHLSLWIIICIATLIPVRIITNIHRH